MKRYTHETVVSPSPESLYRAITDVDAWSKWHADLEYVRSDEPVRTGSRFTLKPNGGPRVPMTVEAAEPSKRFVDVSHLPLAKMRTSHEFEPISEGTRVRMTIEVWGPLAFLWDRVVARKEAEGAEAQTLSLVRYIEGTS